MAANGRWCTASQAWAPDAVPRTVVDGVAAPAEPAKGVTGLTPMTTSTATSVRARRVRLRDGPAVPEMIIEFLGSTQTDGEHCCSARRPETASRTVSGRCAGRGSLDDPAL